MCADCGQYGQWRGDPDCPEVKSGEVPPFKKKAGDANAALKEAEAKEKDSLEKPLATDALRLRHGYMLRTSG